MQKLPRTYFFLFINTVSGGGVGKKFLSIKDKKVKLKSSKSLTSVYLHDLFSEESRNEGLQRAKLKIKQGHLINIIMCGGDGTVIWVIQQVVKYGISLDSVNFCVIPIGTGNDFSRSLKWGTTPIHFEEGSTDELKNRVKLWKSAEVKKFDIWDIKLTTYKGGKILTPRDDESSEGVTVSHRMFSNYVGIGIDARVSYAFQKKRTKSKFLNLALYGCIGFCYFFSKTPKITDAVSQLSESDPQSQRQQDETDLSMSSDRKKGGLLKQGTKQKKEIKFGKKEKGIVILNCTNYMAGVKNVWKKKKKSKVQTNQQQYFSQAFDDGRLQLVSFKNQLELGLERYINICTNIGQGTGPFVIKFKNDLQRKTYVQIDGECMATYGLQQIVVKRSEFVKNGQINTLVNTSK